MITFELHVFNVWILLAKNSCTLRNNCASWGVFILMCLSSSNDIYRQSELTCIHTKLVMSSHPRIYNIQYFWLNFATWIWLGHISQSMFIYNRLLLSIICSKHWNQQLLYQNQRMANGFPFRHVYFTSFTMKRMGDVWPMFWRLIKMLKFDWQLKLKKPKPG